MTPDFLKSHFPASFDLFFCMKFYFSGNPDAADVETLRAEIEDLKEQLSGMTTRAETAEAEVQKLKSQSEEEAQEAPKEEAS